MRLDALEVYARPYGELADEVLNASGSSSAGPASTQPLAEALGAGSAMGPQLPGSFLQDMQAGLDLLAQALLTTAQLSLHAGTWSSLW